MLPKRDGRIPFTLVCDAPGELPVFESRNTGILGAEPRAFEEQGRHYLYYVRCYPVAMDH